VNIAPALACGEGPACMAVGFPNASASSSAGWVPTEEHVTQAWGEVKLTDEELPLFQALLRKSSEWACWRLELMDVRNPESDSDSASGARGQRFASRRRPSRSASRGPARPAPVGRGRGRGRGRSAGGRGAYVASAAIVQPEAAGSASGRLQRNSRQHKPDRRLSANMASEEFAGSSSFQQPREDDSGSSAGLEIRQARTGRGRGASAKARRSRPDNDYSSQVKRRVRRSEAETPPRQNRRARGVAPQAFQAPRDEDELRQRLQSGVDLLSQDQLTHVIQWLSDDVTDENGGGTDYALSLVDMPLDRQRAMLEFIERQLGQTTVALVEPSGLQAQDPFNGSVSAGKLAQAKTAQARGAKAAGFLSPMFPGVDAGDSPLPQSCAPASQQHEENVGTPAAMTGHTPTSARRSVAWEVCSAREVLNHHHLREVEERVSVGGTPLAGHQHGEPLAGEEVPEVTMPPAAIASTGDSMLDRCDEVLDIADFSWM